uniref:Uncharacterized protein n=1 Tax=Catagonus wagneri TaxID=51154 RepID=A0A8C3W745_9CETA
MVLASVLERLLAMNQNGFFRLWGHVGLLDLGPGSPGNGMSLVMLSCVVPGEQRMEMLHDTTTLAFKIFPWIHCCSRFPGHSRCLYYLPDSKEGDRNQPGLGCSGLQLLGEALDLAVLNI